jgi:hypothetical protein
MNAGLSRRRLRVRVPSLPLSTPRLFPRRFVSSQEAALLFGPPPCEHSPCTWARSPARGAEDSRLSAQVLRRATEDPLAAAARARTPRPSAYVAGSQQGSDPDSLATRPFRLRCGHRGAKEPEFVEAAVGALLAWNRRARHVLAVIGSTRARVSDRLVQRQILGPCLVPRSGSRLVDLLIDR